VTDLPNNDELRDRRREEALARRVGDALDQLAHREAVECPDAELIAAYHEKSLQPDEIARWENHFATCTRCRKVLQVLAASVDAPLDEREVARLGELVAAARSPVEATTQTADPARPVRVNWRRRWLAPALGIAAALAIWFVTHPARRAAQQNSPEILIAQAPKSESGPSVETRSKQQSAEAPVTPGNNNEADAEALKGTRAGRVQSANPSTDSLAKKNLDAGGVAREIAPSSNAPENNLRVEKKEKAESNGTGVGTGAGVGTGTPGGIAGGFYTPAPGAQSATPATVAPPHPPSPTAAELAAPQPAPSAQAQDKVQASNPAPPDMRPPPSVSQSVTVTEAVPSVDTANATVRGSLSESNVKDLPLNGRNYGSLLSLKAAGEFPVQINSPSGKILWRAGKGGIIQRSTDAGRTWTAQRSPLQEDWIAAAAVSNTVCWIAGRSGAIGRTTDGNHWKKIAPPPMAADSSGKFPDWISITASGAKNVTITASDQRHFSTQNAGKSWKAQ
jgi:hypothetical protein